MQMEIQELPWCKPHINQRWIALKANRAKVVQEGVRKQLFCLPGAGLWINRQKGHLVLRMKLVRRSKPRVNDGSSARGGLCFEQCTGFLNIGNIYLGLLVVLLSWSSGACHWWLTGEESDSLLLPARHIWLGLSSVWVYPLVSVFARLHANKSIEASQCWCWVCISEAAGCRWALLACSHLLTPFGSPLGCVAAVGS